MTYEEIISIACRRIGADAFDSSLKADLRYAIKFSEEELMIKTNFTKTSSEITMSSSKTEYEMPRGFHSPYQIIFLDINGNMIVAEETSYEHWLRINNTSELNEAEHNDFLTSDKVVGDQIDQALFNSKIAYAINYQKESSSKYILSLKPPIDGKIQVYYSIAPNDDVYKSLSDTPYLPSYLHKYIISGVVFYMSGIFAGIALSNKDYNKLNYYNLLKKESFQEFQFNKQEALEESKPETTPTIMRPFQWFDNLRRYR